MYSLSFIIFRFPHKHLKNLTCYYNQWCTVYNWCKNSDCCGRVKNNISFYSSVLFTVTNAYKTVGNFINISARYCCKINTQNYNRDRINDKKYFKEKIHSVPIKVWVDINIHSHYFVYSNSSSSNSCDGSSNSGTWSGWWVTGMPYEINSLANSA